MTIAAAIRPVLGEQVELRSLKPNPLRDFAVDPIDDEHVAVLCQSIKDDGFWGGIVCRRVGDEIQIVDGHHRIKAAIAAGVKKADVCIGTFDDQRVIQMYARENHRNMDSALAGVVAGAILFLAKGVLSRDADVLKSLGKTLARQIGAALESERGINRMQIAKFLGPLPGITERDLGEQLANLKASGDYARIIAEVQAEIEAAEKAAKQAQAVAEKAAQQA